MNAKQVELTELEAYQLKRICLREMNQLEYFYQKNNVEGHLDDYRERIGILTAIINKLS